MKNQSRQENLTYLAVWGVLFAAPLLSLYVRTVGDSDAEFNWSELLFVWNRFGIFLLMFLIHNFLLPPLLIHQHRRVLYFSFTALLLAGFIAFHCATRPRRNMEFRKMRMEQRMEKRMEQRGERPPMPDDFEEFGDREMPREGMPQERPMMEGGHRMEGRHTPPPIIGEHQIMSALILVLMFGANLGAKLYFRSRRDQRKLQLLEKQNLEQQLEYLKYQINPHFFMNTLNNIHALVDIDPEKAQATILELSRMMRFVLYEGDKSGVPLSKEFEFIRTYIKLMQLRYTDKVKISVDLPTEAPDKTIPPLMLISFIENAFKHGISYQHPSFIDVKVSLDGNRLHFACCNSKAEKPNQEKGGVGLANVRKRLDLLFDKDYKLDIKDEPDIYSVELKIPLL